MMRVAMCWDDGVYNDIRLVELLRKYGAKATFNLNPGRMKPERQPACWVANLEEIHRNHRGFLPGMVGLKELTEIYDGFQVASHCWDHQTAGMVPDDLFVKAAVDAKNFLEDLFQRPCPGFAWPSGVVTDVLCNRLQEAGFAYGRTTESVVDVLAYRHPMALHPSCHFQYRYWLDRYLTAKKTSGVFYFWGHSYELMDCEGLWRQLEMQLRMIAEDPDAQWVDVVDLVQKENEVSRIIPQSKPGKMFR